MKYRITIIAVLAVLIGLLFAYKKGLLDFRDDAYAKLKLPETVDYNFHIKPILSDNCYTCHGPDANKRKAGLRLDLEKTALGELPENPGKPRTRGSGVLSLSAYATIWHRPLVPANLSL